MTWISKNGNCCFILKHKMLIYNSGTLKAILNPFDPNKITQVK